MRGIRPAVLSTWALSLLLLAGCGGVPKKSPVTKSTGADVRMDATTLRVRAREQAGPMCSAIEETADAIMREADDPDIRVNALIWKANAVPLMREALFLPDPLAALMDGWAFTLQLIDYFEEGPGAERLGPWAPFAAEKSREMEREMQVLFADVVSDLDAERGRNFVDLWAADNPLDGAMTARPSVQNQAGEIKAKMRVGTLKMIGGLGLSMDDLADRVSILGVQAPRQARWEAQLAVLELFGDENVAVAVQGLPEVLETVDEMAAIVDDVPGLVATEREAVLDSLHTQRVDTLEFAREERMATLGHLTSEREVLLAELERVRLEATTDLRAELDKLMVFARGEREALLDEAEGFSNRRFDEALDKSVELVDHVFYRLLQLLGLSFVGLLLAMFLWRVLAPRASQAG